MPRSSRPTALGNRDKSGLRDGLAAEGNPVLSTYRLPSTAYSAHGFIRLKALFALGALLLALCALPLVLASPRFAEVRKAPLSISSYKEVFASRSSRALTPTFAATYTWNQTGTASYTTSTNWTPTRTTPANDDILAFNNGATTTLTNVPPGFTVGAISIGGNTNVTLEISPGGTFTISGGINCLDIANGSTLNIAATNASTLAFSGAGNSARIAGTLALLGANAGYNTTNSTTTVTSTGNISNNSGTITSTASNLIFQSGSFYNLDSTTTAGSIPTAAWNSGSTVQIRGYTSNTGAPAGIAQTFSNFTWNCTNQSANVQLGGTLPTVSGDFTVSSTGAGPSQLNLTNSGTPTLTIGGNLVVSGGQLDFATTSGSTTVTVAGDYSQSGGTVNMNVGSSGTEVLKVAGNFSISAGTITKSNGTATGKIIFNKSSGTQTFSSTAGGIDTGTNAVISVDVGTGSTTNTLALNSALAMKTGAASGTSTLTVFSGSTLDTGTNVATGDTFTLNSGGTLGIGSTSGITSSGATGNIQTTTRTFDTGANYTYNGSANQAQGNGLPASVNHLTVANTGAGGNNIVTFSQAVAVNGTFQYSSPVTNGGNLTLNAIAQINSGGSMLSASGPTYGASALLKYNVNGSYNRNNEWGPNIASLNGYPTNVQLSNNTNLNLASSSATFHMAGNLTIDSGSTLNLNSGNLDVKGSLTNSGTYTNAGKTLTFSGVTTQTWSDTTGTQNFGAVVINNASSVVQLNSNIACSTLTDTAGTLNLNGFTLTNSGALSVGSTLKGTGTVSGAVSVSSGGAIAPGNSPGIINSGSVTFTSGSSFNVEIGGTTVGTQYDQLNVTGTVTLGNATLNLTQINSFTPSGGDSFTIINNDGNSDPVSGTFNGLAEGATISNFLGSSLSAKISYVGGDGNDVVLTAFVPHTISGTVFDSSGLTPLTSRTIKLIQNGTVSGTTATTNGSGIYTFTGLTLASGDKITVYISGATEKGATVTFTGTSDITTLDIFASHLVVRSETSTPVTNADLKSAQGATPDADLLSVDNVNPSNVLTTPAGFGLRIWLGTTYAPGADINDGGNWINNGTFTAGSNTVTFNGASNQTIGGLNGTFFSTLTINPSNSANVSLAIDGTRVTTALNINSGTFVQGASASDDFTLVTNTVTVASGAKWQNLGKGDAKLAGNVANNGGSIIFNANGTSCGDTADILIRSSDTSGVVGTTQRTWTGTGTFSMTDVDVRDQVAGTGVTPVPPVILYSGVNSGNNVRWTFASTCNGPYTWIGGPNQNWSVSTNWSPVRLNPATSDVLIFDGSVTPSPIVNNVPTETDAALRLTNGAYVTLGPNTFVSTLTLSGSTGTDLDIPSGTQLTLAGSSGLTIALTGAGHECTVAGGLIFQDSDHRLTGANAGEVTFGGPNGFFTAASGFSGNPFGSGQDGSVIFESGSTGNFNDGNDPFGGVFPAVTIFNSGSTARFAKNTAFSSGRTFGNLSLGGNQNYNTNGGNDTIVLNDFTIESGSSFSLSFSPGGNLIVDGNFEDKNSSAGTFDANGHIVKFSGGNTLQTIKKAGVLNPLTFKDVEINEIAGGKVQLLSSIIISGQLNLTTADALLELNGQTLELDGTISGTGNLKGDSNASLVVNGSGNLGTVNFAPGGRTLSSLTLNRGFNVAMTLGTDLALTGNLTLSNGTLGAGVNTLSLGSSSAVFRTSGYVIGNLQKSFGGSGTGSFNFPMGTANAYSPLDADVTANTNGTLTVKAVQGKQPNIPGTNALQRYWTLNGSGITANLTFHYSSSTPNDIVGNEANYKIVKYDGAFTTYTPDATGTPSASDHFATVNNVSTFSDWTLADPAEITCPTSFTVNSLLDADDATPGDELCDDGAGHCTLRAAIEEANALTLCGTITFDLTGLSGQIDLGSALPALNHNVNINGPAANTLTVRRSAIAEFRILTINNGITAAVTGLTLTNGNLTANGVEDAGGGILNNGTLTLSAVTVSGNTVGGNQSDDGGGIYNAGTLLITNCTISGNDAGGVGIDQGGGIFNTGTLTIINSTLAGNRADGSNADLGGAIYNSLTGTLSLTNCTLSNNTAGGTGNDHGGGIFNLGTANSRNTIVAGNTSNDAADFKGTLTSQGHNLIGSTSGTTVTPQTGDLFDGAASPLNLGALANNGGPTQTMKLNAGSVAIDAGDNCVFDNSCSPALPAALTTDQRGAGFPRKVDGNSDGVATVDIGAVEVEACTTPPATPTASNGGPYCQGATIQLFTPTVSGATYAWTGPNGFTSSNQNPTLSNAATADAGAYSVTITVNGCTSAAGTTNVVVNPTPATPTASNGGPYCQGQTIALFTPTVPGATYSWTGPNGFTSSNQNPTLSNAATADAGAYSVTITVNGCTSAAGTTTVVVNPTPATPTATNDGPNYCPGATIHLSTPTVSGATYSWTGPNGFTSSLQNPSRTNVSSADSGAYFVTVTVNGCTSAAGSTNVSVDPGVGPTLTYSSPQSVSHGGSLTVNSATGPSDDVSVASVVVQNQGTYTGTISVDNAGVVSISHAAPAGSHTITIRATDNCGTFTDATFTLNVNCPAPNTVYVDDDWALVTPGTDPDTGGPATSFGCDSFATIQQGINGVAPGGTVIVHEGTYKENPNVNKAVTIQGPNVGVAGSGVRGAEATVTTNGNKTAVFSITSNNVTIDGLFIDGDDPLVTGGPLKSGDDANVSYGVRPTGAQNHITVQNNIVKHVFIGFRADGLGTVSQSNLITRNWFDSVGNFDFGYCVSLRTEYYADVTNNKMTRAWTGIHINDHHIPGGPASFNLSGNDIHSYAGGILYWLNYNQATGATINGNTMTAESSAVANNFGLLIVTLQDAVATSITNNTITGHHYGVGVFNAPTSSTVTLGATNSISNSSLAGVFLTDNLNFNPVGTTNFIPGGTHGAASTINLTGLPVTGNTGNGLKVEGTTNLQRLSVGTGTIVSGGTVGLLSTGAQARISGNNLNDLAFTGQMNYIKLANNASAGLEINATGVSFDTKTGATATLAQNYAIEDKIIHAIDDGSLGFVRVKAGSVFVSPNSFLPPATTASAQRAADAASSGDMVNIQAGNYTGGLNGTAPGKAITLSPGASPAQVTINGNLTLDSNDSLNIEIDGTSPVSPAQFDNLIVNGTVSLGGATLSLGGSYTPSPTDGFIIIDNDSNDAVSGTFNGLLEGAIVNVNGRNKRITYTGGNGNDVALIPASSDISVSKSAPATVTEGNNFDYKLTISNSVSAADMATGVTASDTLPAGVTFVSASAGCTNSSGTVTCTGADIAAGGSDTFTITVTAGSPATVLNTATATATNDPNSPHTSNQTSTIINAAACVTPPAGMVAWYSGDGNTHDLTGGNDGTLFGGASFAAAKVDRGFSLNGTSAFVQAADTPANSISSAITIDAWIKTSTVASGQVIVSKYDRSLGNAATSYLLTMPPGGQIEWVVYQGDGAGTYRGVMTSGQVVTPGVWIHVAGTFDSSNQEMKVYVDGADTNAPALLGTGYGSVSPINDSTTPLRIGIGGDGGAGISDPFNGLIDEVELFNTALSATDVKAIYDASYLGKCRACATPPSGMISWWNGSGSAPTVDDIAGSNPGSLQPGATFGSSKVGTGFTFDGTSGYINVPDNANLYPQAESFTVDAWIKTSVVSATEQTIIAHYECSNNCPAGARSLYDLYVKDGKLEGQLRDNSDDLPQTLTGLTTIADGLFHQVALQRDISGNKMRLYVDGVEDANAALTETGPITDDDSEADPVTIGAIIASGGSPVQFFNGSIDEVEYFKRALTLNEIRAIADAGSTGKCPIVPYTITSSAGANGSINPLGAVSVNPGLDQSFTITPDAGYQIEDVKVDSGSVGPVSNYTFSNVSADHTISASFVPVSSYTINASADPNGSISPSGAVTVNPGDSQGFTIAANPGYHIADVLVDGGSVGPVVSYTFVNVNANHTIAASFAAHPCLTSPVTVNTTDDTDDADFPSADGVCLDSNGKCSLRAAIEEANAAAPSCGTININFDASVFAAPGPYQIFWSTPLDPIKHNVNINGPGADILTINGGDNRVFTISSGYVVSISGLELTEGLPPNADPNGGAVANEGGSTTIKDCVLTGNSSDGNGAALYSNGGSLTVNTSKLEDNDANGNGGGIYNTGGSTLTVNGSKIFFNSAIDGGGVFNDAGCTATISNSVVLENIASGNGGGISNLGTLKLVNTFVEGNAADQNGGGVHNYDGTSNPTALIVNSTIIDNAADADDDSDGDGGGIFNDVGSVRLMNTIVAFNFLGSGDDDDICGGTDVDVPNSSHNIVGGTVSGGLVNGVNGNQVGVDPMLNPGGAPVPGSPAIDQGDDCVLTTCTPALGFSVTNDQRGTSRPQGPHVDIGAIEVRLAVVNTTADTDNGSCEPLGTNNGCTLREAINVANSNLSTLILFDIPADGGTGPACVSGVCTISPTTNLPAIVNSVSIDGYTQQPCPPTPTGPCSHPNTLSLNVGDDASLLIVLGGANVTTNGRGLDLEEGSDQSIIRGLVINHWNTAGIYINDSSEDTIGGNFIGIDQTGTAAAGATGGAGVLITSDCSSLADDNLIGGEVPAARNIISGNGASGIEIGGPDGSCTSYASVEGNYIGTDRTGKVAVPNAIHGVIVENGSEFNIIGCEVLDGDNLISGNADAGVYITDTDSCAVQGNFIGTDLTGAASLENKGNKRGVVVSNAGLAFIGISPENGVIYPNFISGNADNGIELINGAGVNYVLGNFIGTDLNGTAPVGNGKSGVLISGAGFNTIGDGFQGDGNLISGNKDEGVALLGASVNVVQGNFIGTDINGNVASGLGNGGHGVEVYVGSTGNEIGGESECECCECDLAPKASASQSATLNSAAANRAGLTAADKAQALASRAQSMAAKAQGGTSKAPATLAKAQALASQAQATRGKAQASAANRRGAARTGRTSGWGARRRHRAAPRASKPQSSKQQNTTSARLETARLPLSVALSVQNTSAGNIIAGNGGDGVRVSSPGDIDNLISLNSIFSNTGLGINLGTDGVTPNTPPNTSDHTNGPNHYQNFPVINYASPGDQTINFSIDGTGTSAPYTIEFFVNDFCDGTNGEGKTFIGSTTVNSGDNQTYTVQSPYSFAAGQIITATATDSERNTSEFSACNLAGDISINNVTLNEGNAGTTDFTFTVTLSHPSSQTVTVQYATQDGTTNPATGGTCDGVVDYTTSTGTVSFDPGQTTKPVTISVCGDGFVESDETFFVNLSNPVNATIANAQGLGTISNDDCPSSFPVNTAADTTDAVPGDGFCNDGTNHCSLRAAIEEANALTTCGTITINFTNGVNAITVGSQLTINHNVIIDGSTAPSLVITGNNTRLFTLNTGKTASILTMTLTGGNGSGGDGGAIQNSGTLALNGVTLSGNSAINGGAIRNDGNLVLTNTTISGNTANADGGGLFTAIGQATLTNVTIAYNRADNDNVGGGNGGGLRVASGNVLLHNTIVADNYQGSSPSTTADNINGTVDPASTYNLVGTGGGGLTNGINNNQVGVATAFLGKLIDNGGPTFTIGLLYNSPAIDAGDDCVFNNSCTPTLGSALTNDQRGLSRKADGDLTSGAHVDIGAYERQTTEERFAPVGTNVNVDINDVRLTFPSVTNVQPQTVELTVNAVPVDAPAGSGPAFDIHPTANFYGTPVTMCFYLPAITNPTTFATIKVYHREGGVLVEHAETRDFANKTVCINDITSFSQFVINQPVTPTAANGDVSGQILDNNGNPVEGAAVRMNGTQNRLTITDAQGNYHFDDVQTNGFYVVTPSRANFSFNPAQRSFSELGAHTDAVFTGTSTGTSVNPLDTTEYFVRQQYLDFLGREPDESGFNFWVNNIESCGAVPQCREVKRIDTSGAFFLSIEFQQTGYLVYRAYEAAYGDLDNGPVPLTLREFTPDTRAISNGVVVLENGWQQKIEANKQAFMSEFVQRPRFTAAYPSSMSPAEFVDKLFATAQVASTDPDYAAAVALFGAATDTSDVSARARALRRLAENSTFTRKQFNRAFVLMQYFGYLKRDPNSGRDPDFSGYSFWLDKLNTFNGNFDNAEMVKAFLASTEYRDRFPR